jgi:hypothetical protein
MEMKSLIYFIATSFYYIFGNVKHLVHTLIMNENSQGQDVE